MDFDVIIAGAGPGGCVAARNLARSGLRVGLFDSDERETLGKPIIIESEKAVFDTIMVRMPSGHEVPYHGKKLRAFTRDGREAFCVNRPPPAVALYLDKFSRRLLAEAEEAGAVFHGNHQVVEPVVSGQKVRGVIFRNGQRKQEARAPLTIDATGFSAAVVRKLDPEVGVGFEERPSDLVIAENHFHEIDETKAEEAIKNRMTADEEVWARFGFAGNYSTEYGHLSMAKKRAYILIGFKAGYEGPPIGYFIDKYREKQGYFARHISGGKGMIRISHSLDRMVADGFMAIGEAACQVIPTHGSGVASALYAGHIAAKAAIPALKMGEPTTEALWPYAREYQKGRGGLLASFDVSRLTIDAMKEGQVDKMILSGIAGPEDFYNASIPKGISMSPRATLRRIAGLAKNTDMLGMIGKMARASVMLERHYARYPKSFDQKAFDEWKERTNSLFAPFRKA